MVGRYDRHEVTLVEAKRTEPGDLLLGRDERERQTKALIVNVSSNRAGRCVAITFADGSVRLYQADQIVEIEFEPTLKGAA